MVELRLANVGLLDDLWVSSAVLDGRELLRAPDQEQAFGRVKAVHLSLALVFLLAAAAFGGYFLAATRAARLEREAR